LFSSKPSTGLYVGVLTTYILNYSTQDCSLARGQGAVRLAE
jgi:hypothetical protein